MTKKREVTFDILVNYPLAFDRRAKGPRNYEIVCKKYGFLGYEAKSYKELSQEYDVSIPRLQVIVGRYFPEVVTVLRRLESLGYKVDWGIYGEVASESNQKA